MGSSADCGVVCGRRPTASTRTRDFLNCPVRNHEDSISVCFFVHPYHGISYCCRRHRHRHGRPVALARRWASMSRCEQQAACNCLRVPNNLICCIHLLGAAIHVSSLPFDD